KLKRVQLTFLEATRPDPGGDAKLIDERVWPAVQEEYGRQRAAPGLILGGRAALGLGGALLARRQAQARSQPRSLGRTEPRKLRRKQQPRGWRRWLGRK